MADEDEPVTALAVRQPNIWRRLVARARRGLGGQEPEGQATPPGWQGVPPGAPGAFDHQTSNAMESLAMMGGAYAGSALVQRFQRDWQERGEGERPDGAIDPDLLLGAVASMVGILGTPTVGAHRQSHQSRTNDIARSIGMGALSSWAMRRATGLVANPRPDGNGDGDGWGNSHGAGCGGPDGDGDGYGNGFDFEDGGGHFAARADRLGFPSARTWRFGYRRDDMFSVTSDDARRTERLFLCAGCIGWCECPIHGVRL